MPQTKLKPSFDIEGTIAALRCALPAETATAPLHQPCFAGREWEYVKSCLDSSFVSSVGSFVTRFEKQMAEVAGTSHAIAVVNGTVALRIALMAEAASSNLWTSIDPATLLRSRIVSCSPLRVNFSRSK